MKHIRSIPEPDPAAAVLWRVVADTQPDSAIWARLAELEAQLSALNMLAQGDHSPDLIISRIG